MTVTRLVAARRELRPVVAWLLVLATATAVVVTLPQHPVSATTSDAGFSKVVYEGVGDRAELRFYDASFPPHVQWVDVLVLSDVDADGMVIRARRDERASPYYRASFGFTEGATIPDLDLLAVADGAEITFTYLGATADATATWVARSLTPDPNQLLFENSDPALPTVSGAEGAVAAGAHVRVYESLLASTPIAEASADDDGRFMVTVPAAAGLDDVFVASADNGYAETIRVGVRRAWVTGAVRMPPDEDGPVPSVLVSWFRSDLPHPCDGKANCIAVGALTDRDGRFSVDHDYQSEDPDYGSGPYVTEFHHQEARSSRWTAMGYGNPSPVAAASSGREVTIDIGTVRLTGPDFTMTAVDSTGAPVIEASVDVKDESGLRRGSYTQGPDGQVGLAFGSSGAADLEAGTYRLEFASPFGCLPTVADPIDVTWNGVTATPAEATVVFRRPEGSSPVTAGTSTVPVKADTGSTVVQTAVGDVSVDFTDLGEDAYLSAACGPVPPDVPPTLELLDAPVSLVVEAVDTGVDVGFSAAEVCLPIDAAAVLEAGATFDDLVIAHVGDLGQVEPLPAPVVDSETQTICSTTPSFSGFAVAVDRSSGEPGGDGGSTDDSPTTGGGQPETVVTTTYATGIIDPGATLATAGAGPAPDNPLLTGVTVPGGGQVEITESAAVATTTDDLLLLPQIVEISAPRQSEAAPLGVTFRLDASVIPVSAGSIVPMRDGVPIEESCEEGANAIPDPCVSSQVRDGDGDVTITVRTSRASTWRFGVARFVRRHGIDRYATAVDLVSSTFSSADRVFLATGEGFADALTASVAAGTEGAPVLLTRSNELPDQVRDELVRLSPSEVVIVGGDTSVARAVEAELAALAEVVTRVAGPDRYATAGAVARRFFPGTAADVWVASGENFPDALTGALPAIRTTGPLLLVRPQSVPDVTAIELDRLNPIRSHILGGTASVAQSVADTLPGAVRRVSGADRYHTAVEISLATLVDGGADTLFVATGTRFPDALAGSAVAGVAAQRTGLLLVEPDHVPMAVLDEVRRLRPDRLVLLGGHHSISDEVMARLVAELQ